MCLIINRRAPTGSFQHRWLTRFCDSYDPGLALLDGIRSTRT